MQALPTHILPPWLTPFHSILVALFSAAGELQACNKGFAVYLGDTPITEATVHIIEPAFARLMQMPPGKDGLVYHGLITLQGKDEIRRVFSGQVYRLSQGYLLAAEVDISSFEQMSHDLDSMKMEMDELKRQLARRNHALNKAMEELKEQRGLDALTGLPTRVQLDERIEQETSRWQRYHRPLSLLVLDLDNFAVVNGDYGRETGDEILIHVATIIKQSLRTLDMTVRYGGQEFAILLPETNEMGAQIVAERLRMELESQIILPLVTPLTASIGVAMLLPDERRESLCARAERALRAAKDGGKNCVIIAGVLSECDYLSRNEH